MSTVAERTGKKARAGKASIFHSQTGIGTLDPILLEVLRNRLEAIAGDLAVTIQRTAVSPIVTEANDYSATLLDHQGNLVAGGGSVSFHWVAATRAIRATIERYRSDGILPGDVYVANDPYNGGGMHPGDAFVQRPIFVGGQVVAWTAVSAHLIDIGGLVAGSFAPAATECYQEGIRVPPVRLFRGGVEVTDVWDIFRTNVRAPTLVEMDLRALVAGSEMAQDRVVELVESVGLGFYLEGIKALQMLSEKELRLRIDAMADGVYRATGWTEWRDQFYKVPCSLTVAGDRMVFDFEGASDQAPHFFNSKPYIIKSCFMAQFWPVTCGDLPYNEGLLTPIDVRCPEGSILNSVPPAPMGAGHMHVALNASEAMMQCVRLALGATSAPSQPGSIISGWGGGSALGLSMWSYLDHDRTVDTWIMMDGNWPGSAAGHDRDGLDFGNTIVGPPSPASSADIELLESWYPILIEERRVRPGLNGPGAHRSGGGAQVKLRPYGTENLIGEMLGMREWLPLEGAAGGFPGQTTRLLLHRKDGTTDFISTESSGVVLDPDEMFEFCCGSGGGVGDPLDRDIAAVEADVEAQILTRADAEMVYGVVLDADGGADPQASADRRAEILAWRLASATPPARPLSKNDVEQLDRGEPELPLYPGVAHRGPLAYAVESNSPLAVAPDHWTDGCPVLEWYAAPGEGPVVTIRAYLDPGTGSTLYVEAVPGDHPRAFEVGAQHWTTAMVLS